MRPLEFYRGREQTYVKHFFLEKYLERVAYNILSGWKEFVYIDGFSGPWKSADEAHEDTSFAIALSQLRKVRDGLKERGRNVRIRCLFNDNDSEAYEQLKNAVSGVHDIEIKALCRDFEELVPEIVKFVGTSFSLTFIDPTGWTGFGLQKLQPLLSLRGEVLINFMFDFVNRFLEDPRPEIAETLDPLFGDPSWSSEVEARVQAGESREDAVLHVYRGRVQRFGGFSHVTSTRILKPLSDRAYFHLVYATRHWKGLLEFREVEKKTVAEQERVRADAKIDSQFERTGQQNIFAAQGTTTGPRSYEAERQINLARGHTRIQDLLARQHSLKYEDLLAVLDIPLVWESDLKEWLRDLREEGKIQIPGLSGRATTPRPGYVIVWTGPAR